MKKQSNYPPGWDEARVRRVLAHYEEQAEKEAVAEDEAAFENLTQTAMEVPIELVPPVTGKSAPALSEAILMDMEDFESGIVLDDPLTKRFIRDIDARGGNVTAIATIKNTIKNLKVKYSLKVEWPNGETWEIKKKTKEKIMLTPTSYMERV